VVLQVDKYDKCDKADGHSPRVQRKQVGAGLWRMGGFDAVLVLLQPAAWHGKHAEFHSPLQVAGKAGCAPDEPWCMCCKCRSNVPACLSAYLS
jgi:hypothetical protein